MLGDAEKKILQEWQQALIHYHPRSDHEYLSRAKRLVTIWEEGPPYVDNLPSKEQKVADEAFKLKKSALQVAIAAAATKRQGWYDYCHNFYRVLTDIASTSVDRAATTVFKNLRDSFGNSGAEVFHETSVKSRLSMICECKETLKTQHVFNPNKSNPLLESAFCIEKPVQFGLPSGNLQEMLEMHERLGKVFVAYKEAKSEYDRLHALPLPTIDLTEAVHALKGQMRVELWQIQAQPDVLDRAIHRGYAPISEGQSPELQQLYIRLSGLFDYFELQFFQPPAVYENRIAFLIETLRDIKQKVEEDVSDNSAFAWKVRGRVIGFSYAFSHSGNDHLVGLFGNGKHQMDFFDDQRLEPLYRQLSSANYKQGLFEGFVKGMMAYIDHHYVLSSSFADQLSGVSRDRGVFEKLSIVGCSEDGWRELRALKPAPSRFKQLMQSDVSPKVGHFLRFVDHNVRNPLSILC